MLFWLLYNSCHAFSNITLDSIPTYSFEIEKEKNIQLTAPADSSSFAKASAKYNSYFQHYNSKKQYSLAKKYLDSAEVYARKSKTAKVIYNVLINGIYYDIVINKNYKQASQKYKQLFALHLNDSLSSKTPEIYYSYADVLERLGNYKEANIYLKKCNTINDGYLDPKTSSLIPNLEAKYQLEKIKNTYKQKQKILEDNQYKDKKTAYVFLTLLIVTLILFYFFYQNTILKQENRLKDIQSLIQDKIINATMDGQEMERKKIAAILHDNISAQLSAAGLHLSAFSAVNDIDAEEIIKTKAILKEAHDSIRELSHELQPTVLSKFGLCFALNHLCEKNSNSTIKFKYSSLISKQKRYREEYEMKIYSITMELINNVIKHSRARKVNLDIAEEDDQLELYIRDNGKGFNTNATNEGFGLTQIRARVSSMNGKFIITSSPNKGTSVKIKLPLET